MEQLIYDRTQLDVDLDTEKGSYNFTDLKRIENWCQYLSKILNSYNYNNIINVKTDWAMVDVMTEENSPIEAQMERIRQNLIILRNAFFALSTTPDTPENLDFMTFQKANDIEKILFDIDKVIEYMESDFIYCGVANCGQNRIWQKRFKQRKYEKYFLKNIIPDSSFENDGWNDANYSFIEKMSGDRSLYFPIGTTIIANIEIERPIVGHIYYGRRYMKTNGNNAPADCRFEVFGGDGQNKNWVYAWNQGDYPEWGFNSAIHKIASVDYPTTDRTIIRCFNVNTTADTWVDGLMLIDLTECFGVGNEPDLEWCDNNIPYFAGEKTIRKIKEDEK